MNKKIINSLFAGIFLVGSFSPKLSMFWDKKASRLEERIENTLEKENPGLGIQERATERLEERLEKMIGKRAHIVNGKIVAIEGNTLMVSDENGTYSVYCDSQTKFRRKFWGVSSLDEFSVNDLVNVVGKWANEEKTQINAMVVKNLSIQKRNGVFFGTVLSVSDGTISIQTAQKGELKVTVSSQTRLYSRIMKAITISDIVAGHRIRVKGLWDGVNATITEVTQIKNFTIPEVSPSPSSD